MSVGDVAGLIAAIAFVLLVGLLGGAADQARAGARRDADLGQGDHRPHGAGARRDRDARRVVEHPAGEHRHRHHGRGAGLGERLGAHVPVRRDRRRPDDQGRRLLLRRAHARCRVSRRARAGADDGAAGSSGSRSASSLTVVVVRKGRAVVDTLPARRDDGRDRRRPAGVARRRARSGREFLAGDGRARAGAAARPRRRRRRRRAARRASRSAVANLRRAWSSRPAATDWAGAPAPRTPTTTTATPSSRHHPHRHHPITDRWTTRTRCVPPRSASAGSTTSRATATPSCPRPR